MIWVGGAERLSEGGGKQEERGGAERKGVQAFSNDACGNGGLTVLHTGCFISITLWLSA